MTGTEKELILLGLFFVVAVNEDSAVVSEAVLSYKHVFPAWQPFVACFLGVWTGPLVGYCWSIRYLIFSALPQPQGSVFIGLLRSR